MNEDLTLFKFGAQLGVNPKEIPCEKPSGAPASIAYWRWIARGQFIHQPPNGYGTIQCPVKSIVDREFTILVVLPANPVHGDDSAQQQWWRSVEAESRDSFVVNIKVESTKAFDVGQNSYDVNLTRMKRVVSAQFLVRGLIAGKHTIRIVFRYPGGGDPAIVTRAIRLRSKTIDLLQKIGIGIGAIVGAITILKFLRSP